MDVIKGVRNKEDLIQRVREIEDLDARPCKELILLRLPVPEFILRPGVEYTCRRAETENYPTDKDIPCLLKKDEGYIREGEVRIKEVIHTKGGSTFITYEFANLNGNGEFIKNEH